MNPGLWQEDGAEVPLLGDHDPFPELLRKLATFFSDAIQTPHTFDELKSPRVTAKLDPLIEHLTDQVHNRAIVCALLALKIYFDSLESDESPGVNSTRGLACEYVSWRFVTHLSNRELIHFLLYELPAEVLISNGAQDEESAVPQSTARTPPAVLSSSTASLLLSPPLERARGLEVSDEDPTNSQTRASDDDFAASFENLNALEIASVANAKKFISQRVVQRMIESIWRGDIVVWETLSVDSEKEPKMYNKKKADPFCRLRVPRYLKFFEALFFISFLAIYLAVLIPIQRNSRNRPERPGVPPLSDSGRTYSRIFGPIQNFHHITAAEVLLYVWIIAFAYDEFGEYRDAGGLFYAADFWSLWDIGIVALGLAFFITRLVGLIKSNDDIIGAAFDILALEALFLVPRLCSILSLNPYFGTLIPCLREMTKDFFKFLSLVAILYLGFLTTFTLLARDNFSLREMSWILVKVFFGSSYLGFDVANDISPVLGPPLMLIFVCLTNILLITSLISLLSNSLSRVLDHAREEYLFIYSVYVLEASTSNRLTYFLPPLNLIPLMLRPLRLFVAQERLRRMRIVLLKATHLPHVAFISAYEVLYDYFAGPKGSLGSGGASLAGPIEGPTSTALKRSSYLRAFSNPRTLAAASISQTSLPRSSPIRERRPVARPVTATTGLNIEVEDDLKSLVLRLSSQVEQLTAMMNERQQNGAADAGD